MEKDIFDQLMREAPPFKAEAWYNPAGDCIVYKMVDEAIIAERIDELLTVYTSAVDGRPIGFQIKDVQAIIRKCGYDGLRVSATQDEQRIATISVRMLLLAAYETSKPSIRRRQGYAAVDVPLEMAIPASQIKAAADAACAEPA